MRLTGRPVLALLLVAACANGGPAKPGAAPSTAPSTPSTSASPSASPAASFDVVLAVTRRTGPAELYRAGASRVATRFATLAAPASGLHAAMVVLSATATPDACVVWARGAADDDEAERSVACYAGLTGPPHVVTGIHGRVSGLALRQDGRAIAWLDNVGAPSYQTNVMVADLRDGAVAGVRRIVPDPKRLPGHEGCCMVLNGPVAAAWIDATSLALSINGQDDEGGGLVRMPLDPAHVARGWIDGSTPVAVPKNPEGYDYYDTVVAADAHTALAVERGLGFFDDQRRVQGRAVRVDLATATVVEVVAMPAKGREVFGVSGGPRGVVYATRPLEGSGGPTFYLRLAGEAHGTPLRGLPADTVDVLAQP